MRPRALPDPARRRPAPAEGRVPPHDLAAEESLLGAMLLSAAAIADAAVAVRAEDFYKPAHGHVFDAATALYARGEPVDPVTVADELRRAGQLDAIGGPAVLLSLQANTPAVSSAGRYGAIVAEHATRRRLIWAAGEVAEVGYDPTVGAAAAVDAAEAAVFAVATSRGTQAVVPAARLFEAGLDHLEALAARDGGLTGVPTGHRDLDEVLLGLQPSSLVVVGARPGVGKTAFALNLAASAAVEARLPVVFFSLEMSHLELFQRLVASQARVDLARLRRGALTEADWPRIGSAVGRVGAAPLYFDDTATLGLLELRSKARQLKARLGDLGLVVVDYLQLLAGRPGGAENRQLEVSEFSRGLKVLARELEVPVVALSQLSRNLELRADKRPVLADLRESGSIEADADVVLFLYRDDLYHPDSPDRGTAEVIVAKHRNGPLATVKLAWLGHQARHADMARVP